MPKTKPRYTVELTTEGWQIKDNETGSFLADTHGSYDSAAHEVTCFNAGRANLRGVDPVADTSLVDLSGQVGDHQGLRVSLQRKRQHGSLHPAI